jgi:hypothetical protein
MSEDNQEIIHKIEDIRSEIKEKGDELKAEIKIVLTNLQLFALGSFMVGLLVGGGMSLSKAIWVMFGCGFLWFIYTIHRESKAADRFWKERTKYQESGKSQR